MNIQAKKINIIEWLLQVQDQSIIEKIEMLQKKARLKTYEDKLKPMSQAEFHVRIQSAEEDIKQGRLISHEDLEKESDNW